MSKVCVLACGSCAKLALRACSVMQIVVHKTSGFNIDPYHGDAAAELMADFFEQSAKDPEHWNAISRGSLERIKAKCVGRIRLMMWSPRWC